MITRYLKSQIQELLFKNKIIVLYGARRVGKTTLVKELLAENDGGLYINSESLVARRSLETTNPEELFNYIGGYKLVIIDEAQVVPNIGQILKIIHDTIPQIQIIATGSSSFDLANKLGEPLTGRNWKFMMYPLSLGELRNSGFNSVDIASRLENIMRFGLMPSVFDQPENLATREIEAITSDYLYKDILIHENLKKSSLLTSLLEALALQLGSEVSYTELAKTLSTSYHTIEKYIDLLEATFVIFRLRSLARNPRSELELKKSRKIYFFDLGIRNSLVRNFNPMHLRTDVGALWENLCILERMKKLQAEQTSFNQYFWRTTNQKEIDYIEDYGGQLHAFEFKWNARKSTKIPTEFSSNHPNHTYQVVNQDNFWNYLV